MTKSILLLATLLLIADGYQGQPPSTCQVTPVFDQTTQTWVNLYSNCGPPAEPSRRDNSSPS